MDHSIGRIGAAVADNYEFFLLILVGGALWLLTACVVRFAQRRIDVNEGRRFRDQRGVFERIRDMSIEDIATRVGMYGALIFFLIIVFAFMKSGGELMIQFPGPTK